MLPAETIRTKRDGGALSAAQINDFVRGLVDGGWGEGQVAALAMAIVWRGMSRDETLALTRAMADSGERLQWGGTGLGGPGLDRPVLDKHSTGGVGDKVSLLLAPLLAACGALVPMVSGRGLGHTGGTLDKLQALPGYQTDVPRERLLAVLRDAGCAIVGAGPTLAPADRRLYAVRDVTATVESVPLITASILGKKLAAGLQGLVLDVKCGNGAFMADAVQAAALAENLVQVSTQLGLPARALVSDMNQVLGRSAGNALEVQECIDFLTASGREPRLHQMTLALAAQALCLGGLAPSIAQAEGLATQALASGRAAEAFARMVAGLGGPRDVLRAGASGLPIAPVQRAHPAPRDGWVVAMDTRAIGMAVVALGGGRRRSGDAIDARVGLSHLLPLGATVRAGQPLLRIHAASDADADAASAALREAIRVGEHAPDVPPLIHAVVE